MLGFLSAWHYRQRTLTTLQADVKDLSAELNAQQGAYRSLALEHEALKKSVDMQADLMERYENQYLKLGDELKAVRQEREKFAADNLRLQQSPQEIIREIEVIRVTPVLVFKDKKTELSLEEKATQLLRAFKKGATQNNETVMNGK